MISNDHKNLRQEYLSGQKEPSKILFVVMVILYLATAFSVARTARSEGVLMIAGNAIAISAFTGVISSLGNICIIFMVVFYKKTGFIASIILIITQSPAFFIHIVRSHSFATIPGLFGGILTIIAIIIIYHRNRKIEEYQNIEVEYLKGQQKASKRLFEQTATALVNAIDAKDRYSHGHSIRVAEYSEKIAVLLNKDEEECEKIYYAALLHDVGKIGIPIKIINKKGKLTKEEYEVIKQHPVKGNSILSSISEYPYLSIGAHYHHERYDGKGYPDGLKGEDIPEIARIISVADAYDAMTSNRSYREAIPQQLVREEIVKGAGTQFDPGIANIMQSLIDSDPDYRLKEEETLNELAGKSELRCNEYRSEFSDGILLNRNITKINLVVDIKENTAEKSRGAALILFDSLDGRIHNDEKTIIDLCYFEYGEIWFDGSTEVKGARKAEIQSLSHEPDKRRKRLNTNAVMYTIEAVKCSDHVQIKIDNGETTQIVTIALPDSSRYAYISLTGERCRIRNVNISREDKPVSEDHIKRIAEKISYIDAPEGDIPNVQIDGYRTGSSEGIPINNKLTVKFHTMSLPTARLIWHCPYFIIYSSKDGKVNGENYKEYALIRLDGENWDSDGAADNKLIVNRQDDFEGWDEWKEINKKGYDSEAVFTREGNTITVITDNLGIFIKNTTTINDSAKKIYIAISGDQCALTNIRILQ